MGNLVTTYSVLRGIMIKLHNADCFDIFGTLEQGSIDMVCADIPYGTTRCKWDSVLDLEDMWENLHRVCKINAAMIIFSSQPFTSQLVNSNIKNWKTEIIWEKTYATGFLNAKRQPMRAHENIQVFYRKPPTYNPQMTQGHKRKTVSRSDANTGIYGKASKRVTYDSTSRYPRDVLKFPSDKHKLSIHPTQKPVSLISYLINTYSNVGDTVLDFTMGSGTTGVSCKDLERDFIGIEKDPLFFESACTRLGYME